MISKGKLDESDIETTITLVGAKKEQIRLVLLELQVAPLRPMAGGTLIIS
jgi:hypothetical protein